MNLFQIRGVVRDILSAGLGSNTAINEDPFWNDTEINYAINRGQQEIYKIIKRARADYFTRILRSTDAPLRIFGADFDPSTLRWTSGQGNYTMPPDFVRMRLITDLSTDRVRLTASDLSKSEFRVFMNSNAVGNGSEFLYDVLGVRTIVVRPLPDSVRDFEYIYEKTLPSLRDVSFTPVFVFKEVNTVSVPAGGTTQLRVGDELLVATIGTTNYMQRPDAHYTAIKSIDSPTQVTLEGLSQYTNSDIAGNGAAGHVTFSSVSEIPVAHHHMLVAYAAWYCFSKSTNAHGDSAAMWRSEYDSMVPGLINDVESRQGSDPETCSAYLEDLYD